MKGKIESVYPSGHSSIYNYTCQGEDGRFSFPVEFRYHMDILENERNPVGKEVKYRDDIDPPVLEFLD